MDAEPRVLLASASPRRRELLRAAGLRFEVEPSDVDEFLPPGTDAEHGARQLAARKARAVAERHAGRELWVVGADTVVALAGPEGDTLLGKPEDEDEARKMLGALSGTRHRVVTGVCCIAARTGVEELDAECTYVTMRPLAAEEVEAYVRSGEWRDKAGGYAIQENADVFVTRLEGGGFDNVVGLPVELCLSLLRRAGASLDL